MLEWMRMESSMDEVDAGDTGMDEWCKTWMRLTMVLLRWITLVMLKLERMRQAWGVDEVGDGGWVV